MPFQHGKNGKFYVWDAAGACQDLSGDANSITMSWTRDNPETTTFGFDSVQRIAGIRDATFQGAGLYNACATLAAACILADIMAASINTLIKWMPNGSSSGCHVWTGCFLINQFEVQGPQNAPVGLSFGFQLASGSLTASRV